MPPPIARRPLLFATGACLLGADMARGAPALKHPGRVSFPAADLKEDRRRLFPTQLLALALELAGHEAGIEERLHYSQTRAMAELKQGRLDVTLITQRQMPASEGLVLPTPLRMGLLGLRLLLCRAERAQELAQVQDIAQLKRLGLGYGVDWSDRAAFEQLGFKIVTASTYPGLFAMLRARRSDYLSRGINEIWDEIAEPQLVGSGLSVVPGLALHYPLDDYFIVRPDAPELAELLQHGLRLAQTQGRYQRLFDTHFTAGLRRAALHERRLLRVDGYPEDRLVEEAQQHLLTTQSPAAHLKPGKPR